MWARLHADRVELFHGPVDIFEPERHYSSDIFRVWPPEDLRSILNIVPAAYADAAPSVHHVAIAEHAASQGDHVTVTRTWQDRTPVVGEAPSAPAPQIVQIETSRPDPRVDQLLASREADAVLAASVANPAATFARSDYLLLATRIGADVPDTGNESADILAAARFVHGQIRALSQEIAGGG